MGTLLASVLLCRVGLFAKASSNACKTFPRCVYSHTFIYILFYFNKYNYLLSYNIIKYGNNHCRLNFILD